MYRTIVNLKTNVSLLSRKDIKVYGFHFYLNKMYIYSLQRPSTGPYLFQVECSFKVPANKHVSHLLSAWVSNIWIIRKLLHEQHAAIDTFLAIDEPSPEVSPHDSDNDHYISPRKKMKAKHTS
ncbi:hypothetical protein PS15m_000026 [Mucor circinelloides]